MSTPSTGDTVTIDYILKRTDGRVIGTSAHGGVQRLTLGSGEIFPQIEEALTSMAVGDARTVAIPCDAAFGPRREDLVLDLAREDLPAEPAPQPGMVLNVQTPEGKTIPLVILEVGEETVKADGNHPLAGEDLTFDLTLREIDRAA